MEQSTVAMFSILTSVVTEAARTGALDLDALAASIEATADGHRESGNTKLASEIRLMSEHLLKSARVS